MARTMVEAGCHGGPGCLVSLTQLSEGSQETDRHSVSLQNEPVEKPLWLHTIREIAERATSLNTNSLIIVVPECSTMQGETDMASGTGFRRAATHPYY